MATYRVPVLGDFSWQPPVEDKDLFDAPGAPSKGDRYIVASGTTTGDDWWGHEDDIAWYDGAAWQFDTPVEGWQTWVKDENAYYIFDGTDWAISATGEVDAVSSQLVDAESNISSHTIQIASLESKQVVDSGNISSHTIEIASLESEKIVLESDVSSHTIQIASLESKQVVDTGNISSHTIQIASNESNISSHTIQIASLESKQVVDTGDISSHTIQIASLESKQVVDTGNISSHTVELASAQKEGTYVAEYGALEFTI